MNIAEYRAELWSLLEKIPILSDRRHSTARKGKLDERRSEKQHQLVMDELLAVSTMPSRSDAGPRRERFLQDLQALVD